jgi:hypothetical protein
MAFALSIVAVAFGCLKKLNNKFPTSNVSVFLTSLSPMCGTSSFSWDLGTKPNSSVQFSKGSSLNSEKLGLICLDKHFCYLSMWKNKKPTFSLLALLTNLTCWAKQVWDLAKLFSSLEYIWILKLGKYGQNLIANEMGPSCTVVHIFPQSPTSDVMSVFCLSLFLHPYSIGEFAFSQLTQFSNFSANIFQFSWASGNLAHSSPEEFVFCIP